MITYLESNQINSLYCSTIYTNVEKAIKYL